jgi:hypothetical protein
LRTLPTRGDLREQVTHYNVRDTNVPCDEPEDFVERFVVAADAQRRKDQPLFV